MKQIIIIAGGIISLTIMIAIFVAILVVSVFKKIPLLLGIIAVMLLKTPQHKSTICFSFVSDDVMARYQSLEKQ